MIILEIVFFSNCSVISAILFFTKAVQPPSFNLVEGSGTNQIAEGIAGQNQPIEAFVVSGSVTTGTSYGDRNGGEIVLQALESEPSFECLASFVGE